MKKYVLLIIAMLTIGHLSAQVKIDDFESGDNGWTRVSCGGDLIENPYKTGINLSNHVYRAVRSPECDNWSGAMVSNKVYTGYKYVHAYMYRNNNGTPNVKVSDHPEKDFAPMNAIVANQWQDVVFDISDYETSGTEFIFFMVDRDTLTEDAWMLIDEVQLSNDATPRTNVVGGDNPVVVPTGDWQLVWQDEFNADALDMDIWNIETRGDGGGNNELQYYCNRGVHVQDGCLVLTATKENYGGKTCTSGRVNTLNKVYFTYGKIEARIQMPYTANGLWPAFWMMGNDISAKDWPACGEIDICEMGNVNGINAGTQNRYFNGAFHWGTRWDDHRQYAQDITYSYPVQDGQFHLFSCIWDTEKISMYLDLDKYPNASPYCTMTIPKSSDSGAPGYYFHKPNHILLNLAVGGNFPQIFDINGITALSSGSRSMCIDYVRVYQRGVNGETMSGKSSGSLEGQTTDISVIHDSQNQSEKIIQNGQLLIRRGGHIYTITGQIVQ